MGDVLQIDARAGRESKRWKPAQWKETRRRYFTKHVTAHALREVQADLPPYERALMFVELRTLLDSNLSVHKLHDLGFKTLGETEAAK